MKTYIAATAAEAAGLHAGTVTLLVIPMEPQPKMECIADYHFDLCYKGFFNYKSNGANWLPFAPYVPGDEIQVEGTDTHLLCQSVAARPVQGITGPEVFRWLSELASIQETIESPLLEIEAEWNRRHPALPWAGNPWAWFCTVQPKGQVTP